MDNKKQPNKKGKKIIIYLSMYCLILCGLCLICSPWIRDGIIRQKTSKYTLDTFSKEEINAHIDKAEAALIEKDIATPDVIAVLNNIQDIDREDVVGGIIIEDIGIYLPIMNGTTKKNLMLGATTVKSEQQMGKGNYCLAGHHMRDKNALFSSLTKIELGSRIQISDLSKVYTYEVTDKKTVHQNQVGILNDTQEAMITLFTCDVTGVNTDYRLVVTGKLLDESNLNDVQNQGNEYIKSFKEQVEAKQKTNKYSGLFFIILVPVFALLLLIGGIYFINKV